MIVAVASMGDTVSQHFGRSKNFKIYKAENGKIVSEDNIVSPGHDCGGLPKLIKKQGAEVIIVGGMGQGAINGFNREGIKAVTGASGDSKEVAQQYVDGDLVSQGTVCREHEGHHQGNCGHHESHHGFHGNHHKGRCH